MPSLIPRRAMCAMVAALTVLLTSPGRVAAATTLAPATTVLKPAAIVNTRGTTTGGVSNLWVKDQSGTIDTPSKYVLFQTPGVTYLGYRTYNVPAAVSPGAVSKIQININYKGPAKATQAWTWKLYDWVHSTWVTVGDNTGATANVWKSLQFSMTSSPSRFVNNVTRQMQLQVGSNNAAFDGKLDYEAITLTYQSCTDSLGCVYISPSAPIHITYLLNMPSLRSENGSRVAIDDLGGKILGHNIQYDGHHRPDCDPTASLADVNKMVLDASIVAIIGTTCSVEAQQVIPVVTARGLSMMSPSNTLPSLTDPGTGYFRVSWDDSEQGELAAAYAYTELSKSTAATIHDGSAYSASIAQSFAQKFIDLGGSISVQKTVAADQTDFRTELNAIAVSNAGGAPDMIFMPLFTPASGYVVNQARATTSLSTTFLMGTDVAWDELLMLSTGTDVDGFRFTNVDESQFSSAYATFKTTYHTKYGADPDSAFAAYGYDAFNVVAAAITSSATDLSGGAYLIGRKALRDALYSTSAYAGLTGTITCATDGECGASPLPFGVFQIQKNVWPPVHVYP